MAKDKTVFTCSDCGGTSPKWLGKCPSCGAWNTLIESVAHADSAVKNRFASLAKTAEVAVLSDIQASDVERTPTGHEELDRVLGGGIVEGGVVLIGGDPGIGKSTLLRLPEQVTNRTLGNPAVAQAMLVKFGSPLKSRSGAVRLVRS